MKLTISQLEELLNHETDKEFSILPDGTIEEVTEHVVQDKPLTFKENLGGEYCEL